MNPTLHLQGSWRYELEGRERDTGEWYPHELVNRNFIIPGTTASNRVGNPVVIGRELTKEAVRCLREEYKYLGVAYYQTEFVLGQEFAEKKIELFLERVMFESTVWIDDRRVGSRDSLSTPHSYDITEYIKIGRKHNLTIRIDNRDVQKIGPYPSAYTDETQTIWNGIVGHVEITGHDEIAVNNVVVGLRAKERKLILAFDAEGTTQGTEFRIDVRLTDAENSVSICCTSYGLPEQIRTEVELDLDTSILYWDEFSPKLYDLEITLSCTRNGRPICGRWLGRIGLKEILTKDGILYVNGIPRFLRGNVDCCVFPLTAYPPMDREVWLDICKTTKEYGFNHIRFHSWCPPEAAFRAADEVGLYLQIEGPVWMDNWTGYTVGCHEEHHIYLMEEALRIILQYSHHPSFCIFSNGNELNGDFSLLEQIITELKKKNPFLLYTMSTNWDRAVNPREDIFIAQSVDNIGIRGQFYLEQMVAGTGLNYDNAVRQRSIPVISHEVGQYVVYPDVTEIPKFSGVLKPVNFESIKRNLEERRLYPYVKDYVKASGRLAAFLYKAELEAALRTERFGGIQLLSLQDFPGQSTATVGLLDCFYHSKNIITAEEFRSFCNNTVLLAVMPKYRYTTGEAFTCEVQIAHYGSEELRDLRIEITIENSINYKKEILWSTGALIEKVQIGLNKKVLNINPNIFSALHGRNELTLTAQIPSLGIDNSWNIWVYEEDEVVTFSDCYETLDENAITQLKAGENVIILAKEKHVNHAASGKFFPVFWSPVHFESQDPCGMIINSKHPLFQKYYHVKEYADIEWKNLLENSFSLIIDSLVDFEPITMPVPNFFHNHKLTNLLEANVANGKVLICSLDLSDNLMTYPEIRCFKRALKEYFTSEDFRPTQTIPLNELQKLFRR